MGKIQDIEKKIRQLPDHLKSELEDYLDFLLEKKGQSSQEKSEKEKKLAQNWSGALKEYREEYTSLELEEKAIEWRNS